MAESPKGINLKDVKSSIKDVKPQSASSATSNAAGRQQQRDVSQTSGKTNFGNPVVNFSDKSGGIKIDAYVIYAALALSSLFLYIKFIR